MYASMCLKKVICSNFRETRKVGEVDKQRDRTRTRLPLEIRGDFTVGVSRRKVRVDCAKRRIPQRSALCHRVFYARVVTTVNACARVYLPNVSVKETIPLFTKPL